jgi:hypothetical protein
MGFKPLFLFGVIFSHSGIVWVGEGEMKKCLHIISWNANNLHPSCECWPIQHVILFHNYTLCYLFISSLIFRAWQSGFQLVFLSTFAFRCSQ